MPIKRLTSRIYIPPLTSLYNTGVYMYVGSNYNAESNPKIYTQSSINHSDTGLKRKREDNNGDYPIIKSMKIDHGTLCEKIKNLYVFQFQDLMIECYRNKDTSLENYKKFFNLLAAVCESKKEMIQNLLINFLWENIYAEIKPKFFINFLLECSDQKNYEADVKLGHCYAKGIYYPHDAKNAFISYNYAAKNGNIEAIASLATCFKNGEGIQKNEKKSKKLLQKVFDRAKVFEEQQHLAAAAHYLRLAADHGHADAQKCMAEYYLTGCAVEKDVEKAAYYSQLAAKQSAIAD